MAKIQQFKACNDKEEYEPYPHQKEVANILKKMDKEGNFSTIVTVPTGGGKTKIAVDFCLSVLGKNSNNKILWVSDTIDLLIQSIERFKETNIPSDIPYQLICSTSVYDDLKKQKEEESTAKLISDSVDKISKEANIVFASVETLVQEKAYEKLADWLNAVQKQGRIYLIYDETHHIGAELTERLLRKLHGVSDGEKVLKNFGMIGLTATVYRADSPVRSFNRWYKNGWANGEIVPASTGYGDGENKYVNNRVEVVTIQKLIDEGILVKPEIYRVDDFEKGIPEDSIAYLAQKIKKNYKSWGKTIVFVDSIKTATKVVEKLGKSKAFAYTSETASDVETDLQNFKKLDNKKAKIMIAVDMVSEGFDVKDVETVYLFSRVYSHIVIRQRVGRVLRKHDGKAAKVYWQNYFGHTTTDFVSNSEISYDGVEIAQSDDEVLKDVSDWRKGRQLPAGMYLEELPRDIDTENTMYRIYQYLQVLELFGLEEIINGIGYFSLGDRHIYVRDEEKAGYESFYRVIRSDYFSLLIKQDKYLTFKDYVKALNTDEETLIRNIKVGCFYMPNAKASDKDGQEKAKRFFVRDEDIKSFYEWVVSNGLAMPEYVQIDKFNTGSDNQNGSTDSSLEAIKVQHYMQDNNMEPADSLLEAINIHQSYKRWGDSKRAKHRKEYSELLLYGKDKDINYYEVQSVRTLMNIGAVSEQRTVGKLHGVEGSLAIIEKDDKGNYHVKDGLIARSIAEIYDDDLLVFAQALVSVPNRVVIKEVDVNEYKDSLISAMSNNGVIVDNETKLAREFLCALGYRDNDGFIRMQCELFTDKLPRILQYVIYCKIYDELARQVEFFENDMPSAFCKNSDMLAEKRDEMLNRYGVKLDSDLDVLADIEADYRPYLKAIPYYQGIKPEFLCRMLNEMLRLGNKDNMQFLDGFGGSGTVSMNVDSHLGLGQTYNDLGRFNTALYNVIKSDDGVNLIRRVEAFIDIIINHTGDEKRARKFLNPALIQVIKSDKYNFISDSFEKIEQIYQDSFDKAVDEHNEKLTDAEKTDGKEWGTLTERLKKNEDSYIKILDKTSKKPVDNDVIRNIEKFTHVILLYLGGIYDALKNEKDAEDNIIPIPEGVEDADLAFVFFMINYLSARHFYNDSTISQIVRFIGTYKQNIKAAAEAFSVVEVKREDALSLAENNKDNRDIVAYYDIPYSETDISTYSSDWFNEKKFVDILSKSKGDYIVASRFNICETRGGGLADLISSKIEKSDALKNKEKNIIKFYSRFVPEVWASEYVELIKKEFPVEENESEDYEKDDANPWSFIDSGREAKYIVFAYSQTEQTVITDEKGNSRYGFVRNNLPISKDSVRRMLRNTQISNVEVEIMLTNMKLDFDKMPVDIVEVDEGLWYVPMFTTTSSYKIEPVMVIMSYEDYIKDILLNILAETVVPTIDATEWSAAFREKYENIIK